MDPRRGPLTARPEPETINKSSPWTEEERSYWAFQPVRRPPLPAVQHADLVRSPIDAFLLQKLEEQSRSAFAPEADSRDI